MELMTQALWHHLPPLNSQKEVQNPLVFCHFYLPDTEWDWFVLEFDGIDTFYGWSRHMSQEFATFYLSELRILRGLRGMPVIRNVLFTPKYLKDIQQRYTSPFQSGTHLHLAPLPYQQTHSRGANTLLPMVTPPHL